MHSKLKEGFVSVAAFQPQVSYVISSLRRIEHSCQQGKRLDKKEVHAHLHSKLKEWFVSVGAFQPQVSDIISRLRRVEYSCQQEDRDQIWSVHICTPNLKKGLYLSSHGCLTLSSEYSCQQEGPDQIYAHILVSAFQPTYSLGLYATREEITF